MAIVIRQLARNSSTIYNLTFRKSIMTSAHRAEKVVEELKKNPYFEKYCQKIEKLQHKSPEEFLSKVDAHEKEKVKPKFGAVEKERQFSPLLKPKEATSTLGTTDRNLNDIMKLDLVMDKNPEEIKRIWAEYHLKKDVISAAIPVPVYEKINERSAKYPTFIFPLPRTQGYEFIMCQFLKNTVHFTPLICYQVHKENAPECLTIIHYTELKADKELVLMRGEFDKDVIDAKEAQCLANQLQMYYGQDSENKIHLLETFTFKPDEFKHMELISELENL